MANQAAGINQERVQRQIVEDAEKLHPWPREIGVGPDLAAVTLYHKAQLQRSHRKWTPLDLIELARICKLITLADIEFERYLLEGVVIYGGKSGTTPVENPRGRAVNTMNSTMNQMLRRLGIAAMSVSEKTATANEAEVEREARASKSQISATSSDEDAVPDDALMN